MKCERCKKNKATFIYSESINGVKKELCVCDKCAKELGLDSEDFGFNDFFFDTASLLSSAKPTKKKEATQEKCKVCGFSFSDIVKQGKFGCSNCYDTFSSKLDEVFVKMYGKNRYAKDIYEGKEETEEDKIEILERKLKEAVAKEDYETAAKLRDRIKELKGKEV